MQSPPTAPAHIDAAVDTVDQQTGLRGLLAKLHEPARTRDELQTYVECDPAGFRDEALQAIVDGCDANASSYLIHLLVKSAKVIDYLADVTQSSAERSTLVAKALYKAGAPMDTLLDERMAAAIVDRGRGDTLIRLVDLYVALGCPSRILTWREQLMAHADARVRSKAAFAIALASKSAPWVASILFEADFRIQASAVEALWRVNDKDVKPVLTLASRSPNGRVAANALIGLYLRGALDSIVALMNMAAEPDVSRRASAIWAMGETRDPRFLPFLAREFERTTGKDKQRIIRALSTIRRQQKAFEQGGALRASILDRTTLPDRSRRVVLTVASDAQQAPAKETELLATNFAIWENHNLVLDYSVRRIAAPPLLVFAFVLPRFQSEADDYAKAVNAALNALIPLKRSGDLWCFERYHTGDVRDSMGPSTAMAPADEPRLALHLKHHHGLIRDAEFVSKVAGEPGARERAARHECEAIERGVEVTSRVSGVRHIFVFFDANNVDERRMQQLAAALKTEAVTVHGYAPDSSGATDALRCLCESTTNGSFESVPLRAMAQCVKSTYLNLMTRYEVRYERPSDDGEPRLCTLLISSPQGCARESIDFRVDET